MMYNDEAVEPSLTGFAGKFINFSPNLRVVVSSRYINTGGYIIAGSWLAGFNDKCDKHRVIL